MTANAVLIRSKITRPGGTTVSMQDGTKITFKPDENGDHVAMVTNREHINRLLAIPEGYELHFADTPAPAVPVLSAPPKAVLIADATPVLPAPATTTTAAPVEPAQAAPIKLPENTADLDALTDEEIKAIYQAEWNKPPHPKAKRETIIAQIEARREEATATK